VTEGDWRALAMEALEVRCIVEWKRGPWEKDGSNGEKWPNRAE